MSISSNKIFRDLKALLFQVSDEELEQRLKDTDDNSPADDEDDFTRGGEDEEERDPMTGARSEYWFEHIENTADENTNRSRENKMVLSRLDLRTTWIMRILLAIVATVAGTYLISAVPL